MWRYFYVFCNIPIDPLSSRLWNTDFVTQTLCQRASWISNPSIRDTYKDMCYNDRCVSVEVNFLKEDVLWYSWVNSHCTKLSCIFGQSVSDAISCEHFLFHMEWTWWRHQMETFSALLVLCAHTKPVTRSFDLDSSDHPENENDKPVF